MLSSMTMRTMTSRPKGVVELSMAAELVQLVPRVDEGGRGGAGADESARGGAATPAVMF